MGVTVIIAAYQAERTIARAVRSVLAEPEAVEIVVVDDASGDATAEAAAQAVAGAEGAAKLKIIRFETNRGPSAARNAALAASMAPFVTVLDSDDFMQPGRLRALLDAAADADFVADDLLQVDEGREHEPPRIVFGQAAPQSLDLAAFVQANVPDPARPRGELGFLKPLMRRSFLERHGLVYDERVRLGEDYDLYARALAEGARFLLTPALGYVSVVRAGSLSGRHSTEDLRRLRDVDDRLLSRTDLSAAARAALRRHRVSTDKRLQWRIVIDAWKARDPVRFGGAFLAGPEVALHLGAQLWRDVDARVLKRRAHA
ncbi:MAG: glycosyltransferase family 2 protein [Alphaproteobacteria bacterium]|nr:glycosyltransferase family 2 protein [Alphaproteobacteria bacterium]